MASMFSDISATCPSMHSSCCHSIYFYFSYSIYTFLIIEVLVAHFVMLGHRTRYFHCLETKYQIIVEDMIFILTLCIRRESHVFYSWWPLIIHHHHHPLHILRRDSDIFFFDALNEHYFLQVYLFKRWNIWSIECGTTKTTKAPSNESKTVSTLSAND